MFYYIDALLTWWRQEKISTWFLETFADFRALKNLQADIIYYVFSLKM